MNNNTQTKYDFSPLHINVTRTHALLNYFKNLKHNATEFIGFIFLCFIGVMWFSFTLVLLYVGAIQASLSILATGIFISILTIGFLYLVVEALKNTLQAKTRIEAFAKANNIELLDNSPNPNYNGLIFGVGDTKVINQAYVFKDENPLEVGNYSFVSGSGKNSRQEHFGYVKISLPRRLPHILLDSTYSNLYKNTGILPVTFDPSQKLQLEGDFNKHFVLYAPKQYETDVMYILTPDVMQTLIDSSYKYDIEIIDNNLYIYANVTFRLDDEQEVANIRNIAAIVTKQINHQADFYADSNIANRTADVIAPQGQRLKNAPNTLAILLAVMLSIYVALLFVNQTIPLIIVIMIIVITAISFVYIKFIKNSK